MDKVIKAVDKVKNEINSATIYVIESNMVLKTDEHTDSAKPFLFLILRWNIYDIYN